MKWIVGLTALIAVASVPAPASAKGKCVLAGGSATMITIELAQFMAGAALKNSIANNNWRAVGAPKTTCDYNSGLPHCVARQKACG